MSKTIISIDIGKHGAIIVRKPSYTRDEVFAMPMVKDELNYPALYAILSAHSDDDTVVIFEKLGVIFGTSKATAFSMGYQSGAVEMACIALGLRYLRIAAKVWQKEMFQGVSLITKKSKSGKSSVTDTKATALIVTRQLFPQEKLTFGEKASKPHDGLIDAMLMAEYAKRKNL